VSFLAPIWFAAAGAAVVGVIALHLITTQRPPPAALPTARFVPQGDARASSRAARPTDLLLLLLRCAALILLGTAFAGPITHGGGSSLARVVIADRSRSTDADTRDSAAALVRGGDALVTFDSVAKVELRSAGDSAKAISPGHARGSLSAALVAARRAARELARLSDSVELVIVSPLAADELDAATAAMIANWPGRARLVRTSRAQPAAAAVSLVSDIADDELRPAIDAMNAIMRTGPASPVRVIRKPAAAADSAAARDGAAIVVWPHFGAAVTEKMTAQGLSTGDATLIAPLGRVVMARGGIPVARWADGEIAATESPAGHGCIRAVGIGVPAAGDISLQPAFFAVARSLLAPCGGAAGGAASDSIAREFTRSGPAAMASALRTADESSPLAPWLLAGALLLLAAELFVRRASAEVAA
jgi:aerotolerance regulator-like protein